MSISVQVTAFEVRQLKADMTDARKNINKRVLTAYGNVGPKIVRTARRVVRKDTGSLMRSIDYTINRGKVTMRVGPMLTSRDRGGSDKNITKYASFVHDGTSRMSPNPFMSQAIERHTSEQSVFLREIRKAGVANLGSSTGGLPS